MIQMFSPRLNNVSTLPCETSNASAITELLQEETPLFIPPQLWTQNLPDLNTADYKIRTIYLNELKQRLRTQWAKLDHVVIAAASSHLSVASLIAPDQ